MQKSHQKGKYMGFGIWKTLGTIFKVDKRTSTNGRENKKTHDNS